MSELESKNNTFARVNGDGLIEVVDEMTGEVVAIQKSYRDLFKLRSEQLVEHELEDGRVVFLEKGLSLDAYNKRSKAYVYSETICDIICQRITQGESLTRICKDENMPSYQQVSRWRRRYDHFEMSLRQATEDRGHVMRDMVLAETVGDLSKDEVPAARLRSEIRRWAAEKDNPESYGARTKVVGDINAPLKLIIETGVPQPDDDSMGVINGEGREINTEGDHEVWGAKAISGGTEEIDDTCEPVCLGEEEASTDVNKVTEEINGKAEAVLQDAISSADSGCSSGEADD